MCKIQDSEEMMPMGITMRQETQPFLLGLPYKTERRQGIPIDGMVIAE
jgi:hypothetical protein